MKKLFGLIIFLALVTVTFASAEVVPTVDDVGIEMVSQSNVDVVNLVSLDVEVESLVFMVSTLSVSFSINTDHYVSTFYESSDMGLKFRMYRYIYVTEIYNPPLETPIDLSSFCLVDKQVSLRA